MSKSLKAIYMLALLLIAVPATATQTTPEPERELELDSAEPKVAADTFKLAGKLIWITSVSDLVSTEIGLARGGREANPLMRRRAIRIPAKIGVTYLINRVTADAASKGKRKSMKILRWCIVGTFAFVTGNNIVVSF